MSLRLVTNDNKHINVSLDQILEFKFITSMLHIEDTDNNSYELEEDYEIPLDISFSSLEKILEFSNYELNNKETHIHGNHISKYKGKTNWEDLLTEEQVQFLESFEGLNQIIQKYYS